MRKNSRTAPWPKKKNDCNKRTSLNISSCSPCYTVEEISTGRYLSMSSRMRAAPLQTDRKSTRLNSSHQISSYAVCCLKTKKVRDTRGLVKRKPAGEDFGSKQTARG